MNANNAKTGTGWSDPDEAPDLSTPEWQDKLDAAPVRRGRPPAESPKVSTTIRLDADLLEALQKSGKGWQTRANAALRKAVLGE